MTPHLGNRVAACSALVLAAWLGSPALPAAQQRSALVSSIGEVQGAHTDQSTPADQTSRDALPEYPSLHLSGFADVDFAAQNKAEGLRGFSEGQFVLHLASALSPRVNFFGELSLTPRGDAGTGTPAATGF